MKKVFLTLIVCCAMLASGFAQAPAKEEVNPNAPEITFEELVHDFGDIEYKGKAECEFVFTNTGKEPLIIQSCQATCGCTTPTCPKDEPIKPGEKGSIKVKYNNTHVSSPFNKSVVIRSNAKTASVTVSIKGVIGAKPDEKPASN
jgi:hypothetical protein